MFDGFKAQLPPTMKDSLLQNDLLDFKSTFSYKTGLLDQERFTAVYPIASKSPSLRFKIMGNYIEVKGSLHKYFQNGMNFKDYSYADLVATLIDFKLKFGINLSEAIIHNLEFGLNIELEGATANEVLDNCMLYKTKAFSIDLFEGKGKMRLATPTQYHVKIYDKGIQYLTGDHLIRIEKKNKKMERLGKVTFETILTPDFICLASEQLLNLWSDVVLFEPNVCLIGANKPSKALYLNWSNPNYLSNLVATNKTKFKYERRKYNELINRFCSNSFHQQIEDKMLNKLIDFETEANKTYTKMTARYDLPMLY